MTKHSSPYELRRKIRCLLRLQVLRQISDYDWYVHPQGLDHSKNPEDHGSSSSTKLNTVRAGAKALSKSCKIDLSGFLVWLMVSGRSVPKSYGKCAINVTADIVTEKLGFVGWASLKAVVQLLESDASDEFTVTIAPRGLAGYIKALNQERKHKAYRGTVLLLENSQLRYEDKNWRTGF